MSHPATTARPDCSACCDTGVLDLPEGQIRCPLCCMGAPGYRVAAPAIAPEFDGADRQEIPTFSGRVFLACSECGSAIGAIACCVAGCA